MEIVNNKSEQGNSHKYSELKKRLNTVQSYWSTQYDNMRDDMRFATGDQWSAQAKAARVKRKLPVITKDFTKNYIDRICNPIAKYPFGMLIKHIDPKINELYQGLIRDIEYRSNAVEAYQTAFRNAVGVGIGYIIVSTDYSDNETLNQRISLERVADPTTIFIDPNIEKMDGSDMEYAMQIKFVDKELAEIENPEYDDDDPEGEYICANLFSNWIIPDKTVPEMIYWSRKRKTIKRTWFVDGTYIDGKPDVSIPDGMIAGSRNIEIKYVEVSKFIDGREVSKTKLETEYIPVIPVFGDAIYKEGWKGYAGLVHRVRDTQATINYYASLELQRIQLAPVSPWIIANGQTKGFEKMWATANTEAYDSLVYNPMTLDGIQVSAPTRADNTANTSDLIQSRMSSVDDMQRSTGIFDNSIGNEDIAGQSGKAILLKQNNGEIGTYHYTDNLMKSIKQCGRIVLELINSIYDTDRKLDVRGEDGSVVQINGNVKEAGRPAQEFDTEVEAGPMLQNSREQTTAVLLEVARLDPTKAGIFTDFIVENTQLPNSSKIVERIRKTLPPELLEQDENAPNPQAIQALQAADETIQQQQQIIAEYEGIITNLQTMVIDNESDRKAKIETEQIKSDTDLAIAELNNATKVELERMKLSGKTESDMFKIMSAREAKLEERINGMYSDVNNTISSITNMTPESAMERTQKTAGPISFDPQDPQEDTTVDSIDDLLSDGGL